MTLQELLKANGVAEEAIEKIVAGMKENKIYTASEENLDIRYGKLKADFDGLTAQHGEATKLIEQLKAGSKDSEKLQGQIAGYEAQMAELQAQLNEAKLDASMDRELTAAGARPEDLDYLKFQWRKKGEIVLDENGKIKNGDDAIAGMKAQFQSHFASKQDDMLIELNRLPDRNLGNVAITKEQFDRMGYQSRLKLKQEQPDVYAQMTGKATE